MNQKKRKIPLRKCVVTGEQLPKQELLRIVRNKEGEVMIDEGGRLNGRGAYLKKNLSAVKKAMKSRKLDRHLEVTVPDSIYEQLLEMFKDE